MSQSLAKLYTHVIFSTKSREPWLTPELRHDLIEFMGGILQSMDTPLIAGNAVNDHVHLLFVQSRNHTLAFTLQEIKRGSSKWIKTHGKQHKGFTWQAGYGAFSVSASKVQTVTRYIERQETHHRRVSFKEEFIKFLDEYGVDYDERHLWSQ